MKKIIFIAILAIMVPSFEGASGAYYLKLDDIEGESSSSAQTQSQTEVKLQDDETADNTLPARSTQTSTQTNAQTETTIQNPDDESTQKKGNVEYNWKVEEGEKSQAEESGEKGGTADINIGIGELENTSNFGILLSSGSDDDTDENQTELELLLLTQMQSDSVPAEQVSLNFEKIKTKVRNEIKLFGIFPITARATVEIDAEQKVRVKFPWWSFLASGKNKEELGNQVFTSLSNILKSTTTQASDDAPSSLQGSMGF